MTLSQLKYEYSNITRLIKSLNIINENYTIKKIIKTSNKKGSYVVSNNTGKKFFLKAKLKDFVTENELNIYKKIKKYPHKNINKINAIYETSRFVLIISDFIEGFEMGDSKYWKIYEDDLNNIFMQLLNAILHLNSLEISHCDINPTNIMINIVNSRECVPVLIDFDFARFFTDLKVNKSYGSLGFIPPEIHEGYISSKTDEWALAMSFYFRIFKNILSQNDIKEIETESYYDLSFLNLDFLNKYDGKYKQLVLELKKMLNVKCEERPDIQVIINKIRTITKIDKQ